MHSDIMALCMRCPTPQLAVKDGLCAHCSWAINQEVSDGFKKLDEFLAMEAKKHENS